MKPEERMKTFKNWPAKAKVHPLELVKAGFYYLEARDQVMCPFCHIKLQNWCRGDVPLEEHKKGSPTCQFVQGFNEGDDEPRAEDKLEGEMSKQRDPETQAGNQHHSHPRGTQQQQQEEEQHSLYMQPQQPQHQRQHHNHHPHQQQQQQSQHPSLVRVEQGYHGHEYSLQNSSAAADATERKEVWMRNTTEGASNERKPLTTDEADTIPFTRTNQSWRSITPPNCACTEISEMECSEEEQHEGRAYGTAGEEQPRAEERLEGEMSKRRNPETLERHHHHPRGRQKQQQEEEQYSLYMLQQQQQQQQQHHPHHMQPQPQQQQQHQQEQQASPMCVEQGYRFPDRESSLQSSSGSADATDRKEVWMRSTTEYASNERNPFMEIEADSSPLTSSNQSLRSVPPQNPAFTETSRMECSEEEQDGRRASGNAGIERRDNQQRMETHVSDTLMHSVLAMGFARELVQNVMEHKLQTTGESFSNAEDLVEAIVEDSERRQVEIASTAQNHRTRPHDEENQQQQHLQLPLPLQLQRQRQQQQQQQQQHQQPNQARMAQGNPGQEDSSAGSAAAGTTTGGKKGKKKGTKRNKCDPYAAVAAELSWDPISFQNNNPSNEIINSPAVPSTGTTGVEDEPDERDAEELKEENEKLRQQRICKVCLEKEACIVFQPCGHLVCCDSCSTQINRCAVCHAVITDRVHAFLS